MITTPAPKVSPTGSMARTVTNGNQPHNFTDAGEVMPTRSTAGNNVNATTAMNSAALGGINTNLIGTHTAGIQTAAKAMVKTVNPKALAQHLDTITSHVKAVQNHMKSVIPNTAQKTSGKVPYQRTAPRNGGGEADAGDMSHYDPTGGLGNKGYEAARK